MALKDQSYKTHGKFSERDRAAVAFAEELTLNPPRYTYSEEPMAVSAATRNRLKELFSEVEILELIIGYAGFNFMNRINRIFSPDVDVEPPPQELLDLLG